MKSVTYTPGLDMNDDTGRAEPVTAFRFPVKVKKLPFTRSDQVSAQRAFDNALAYYETWITAAGWKPGMIPNQSQVLQATGRLQTQHSTVDNLICLPRHVVPTPGDHTNHVATEPGCCKRGAACHGQWEAGTRVHINRKGIMSCNQGCNLAYQSDHDYNCKIPLGPERRKGCSTALLQLGIPPEDHSRFERESDICMWVDKLFQWVCRRAEAGAVQWFRIRSTHKC